MPKLTWKDTANQERKLPVGKVLLWKRGEGSKLLWGVLSNGQETISCSIVPENRKEVSNCFEDSITWIHHPTKTIQIKNRPVSKMVTKSWTQY